MPVLTRRLSSEQSNAAKNPYACNRGQGLLHSSDMKLFFALVLLAAGYTYVLLQTTDTVLSQTQHLQRTYQFVAAHSDQLATGR